MPDLLIPDLPSELHLKLRQAAERNGRSIEREAIAVLEVALEKAAAAMPTLPDPISGGFLLTDEFLDRTKREGRE